ncbi:LOB domain-containing protein 22-like protein [Tanacetum coccineum]
MTTQNNHPNQPPPIRNPSSPPCAACRHIRRKCTPDCIFAPYFPQNRNEQFQNARKLFGVSFITRTMENINDREHRDDAMASIVYEADARARDPVGGCSRIVLELVQQLKEAEDELKFVKQLVEFHKSVVVCKFSAPDAAVLGGGSEFVAAVCLAVQVLLVYFCSSCSCRWALLLLALL